MKCRKRALSLDDLEALAFKYESSVQNSPCLACGGQNHLVKAVVLGQSVEFRAHTGPLSSVRTNG